jgi:hypothetical protein
VRITGLSVYLQMWVFFLIILEMGKNFWVLFFLFLWVTNYGFCSNCEVELLKDVAVLAENLGIEMDLLNGKASKDLGILYIGRNWSKFGVGYFVLDFQRGYFYRVDFLIEAMPRNKRRRNQEDTFFCCKLIFCVEVM